jgi:hypothetical protein
MRDRTDANRAEPFPDPTDRAAHETAVHAEDALGRQRREDERRRAQFAPRPDGECACGCGNDVDPRRLALGYGLALECADRMDRVARGHR